MTSHLVEHIQDPQNLKVFQQERLLIDVASLIYQAMQSKGVTRKELADKLEVTKGMVTRYLGGERNLTLRTLADIFTALGFTLVVDAEELSFDESSQWQEIPDLPTSVPLRVIDMEQWKHCLEVINPSSLGLAG